MIWSITFCLIIMLTLLFFSSSEIDALGSEKIHPRLRPSKCSFEHKKVPNICLYYYRRFTDKFIFA